MTGSFASPLKRTLLSFLRNSLTGRVSVIRVGQAPFGGYIESVRKVNIIILHCIKVHHFALKRITFRLYENRSSPYFISISG
jgi:hypothetical protein